MNVFSLRTTSIVWAAPPEQGDLGNPSPSSHSQSQSLLILQSRYVSTAHGFTRALMFGLCRYDVELFQRIEALIGKKLPAFPTQEEEVMMLMERVSEAQRFARIVSPHSVFEISDEYEGVSDEHMRVCFSQEMKESSEKRKRPKADEDDADDGEQSSGVRKKIKGGSFRGRAKRGR